MRDFPTDLPTPFLLIDETIVEANLSRLAGYARQHRIAIRPHTKTHKSIEMAQRQLAAGAVGLTVAKAGEAEVMATATTDRPADLLLAYPPVDPHSAGVIAKLAKTHAVRVALDTVVAVESIASAARLAGSLVGVLVDLDVGMGRTGVATPLASLELARAVGRHPSLRVDGLFFYPGHIWAPPGEQPAVLASIDALLRETIDLWSRDGIACPVVSGGSTPTLYQSHHLPTMTEARPGTYVYNDMNTVRGGYCRLEDCAARIVCTVISNAVKGKVVVDAGSKTLAADRNAPRPDTGHGHVVEHPHAVITRLTEEHGELDIRACDPVPNVGDRVSIIPNHICPCVNLHDAAMLSPSDGGPPRTLPISARGRVS